MGRFDPFATPSEKVRYLREAAIVDRDGARGDWRRAVIPWMVEADAFNNRAAENERHP
jgi:hypothetical protein